MINNFVLLLIVVLLISIAICITADYYNTNVKTLLLGLLTANIATSVVGNVPSASTPSASTTSANLQFDSTPSANLQFDSTQFASNTYLGGKVEKKNNTSIRLDNLYDSTISPDKLLNKIKNYTYDEYDDASMLRGIDKKFINTFDNVVIDGNNFIYRLRELNKDETELNINKYSKYLELTCNILTKSLPNKNIFIVLKDPESDKRKNEFINFVGETNIKDAHKKYFSKLLKKYKNTHFVVAYGSVKHRDDYATIWVSDVIQNSIILSRDRYRDVHQMSSSDIEMIIYGSDADRLNTKINKPFTHVTKGVVKNNLVGYTFTKNKKSGFYDKDTGKPTEASKIVLLINIA